MKKIKVLHTLPGLHVGGVANLLLKLLQNFDDPSIEHHLCYFGNNEAMLTLFEKENVRIHKISYSGFHSIFVACKKFRGLVLKENFQVIHTNLFLDRVIVGLTSFFLNIPVIVSIHTTNSYSHNPSIRQKSLLKIEDILGNITTHKFIAVSNTVKEVAIKERAVHNDKIVTIHSGVGIPDKFDRLLAKNLPVKLIAIGRLYESKKFDHLLQSVKLLIERNINVELTILGDGPLRNKLENLSKDLGITEKVNFPGFTTNVSTYLKESDIFVTCSTEEGFGLSVVEAMSYSLPVVAYDIPIFREISHNGSYFLISEVGDFEKFSNNIVRLITSPYIYSSYAIKSRQRSLENFDIRNSASRYLKLYSQMR